MINPKLLRRSGQGLGDGNYKEQRQQRLVDEWTDYDTVYAQFTQPDRGGVLSDTGRNHPKVSRSRLREDSRAILWRLHWAVRDLVSARAWGQEMATETHRLRDRLTEVFGLLTDEQKAEMYRRDKTRTPPTPTPEEGR